MVGAKDETCEDDKVVSRFKSLGDTDITEEFIRLAKELKHGEIVMHSKYSLSEAVSAIELLDPKMDSGMKPPDPNLGLENALKSGKIRQKLTVTELLATVDCTFAAIASWLHDAQALDQTVFTNIWLHDLSQINDPIHQALSKAAVFFVQTIRLVVTMSACYSEEDFIAIFSFENSILTFDEVLKNLNKVEEAVLMRIKAKQNKQENMALLNRIRFYQQILIAFESLVPASDRPASSTDKKWQPQIGFGKAAIKTSLTHMQNSCDTIKLGRQPSDGNDADYSWLNCFQPKVNQHTLPPTFPKEIKFMSRLAGYNYIISIFQSVLNMLEEMPQPNNIISLDTLLEFFERYSYAGVITRSMNQLILLPVDDCLFGVRPMVDLVSCSISEFAPSIQQDKLQQYIASVSEDLAADYDEFLMDAVRAFLNIIQLFGHNRARFHDQSLPELIDSFSSLRAKALTFESNLREMLNSRTDIRRCFSTFADFYATRLSLLYIDMGFQLELFVDYELPCIFWCYSDVLYRRIVEYCKTRSQLIAYDMTFQRPNTNDYVRAQARERYVRTNLHRMLVYEDVSTGSFLLFSALADDGKIQVPPHEEDRFWRRMYTCMQIFADEELSYDRYWNYFIYARERDDPPTQMKDWTVESRYKMAIEYFKRAESTMNRNFVVSESLTKAIKSNLIAISMLLKKLDTGKKIRVEYIHGPLIPTVSIK